MLCEGGRTSDRLTERMTRRDGETERQRQRLREKKRPHHMYIQLESGPAAGGVNRTLLFPASLTNAAILRVVLARVLPHIKCGCSWRCAARSASPRTPPSPLLRTSRLDLTVGFRSLTAGLYVSCGAPGRLPEDDPPLPTWTTRGSLRDVPLRTQHAAAAEPHFLTAAACSRLFRREQQRMQVALRPALGVLGTLRRRLLGQAWRQWHRAVVDMRPETCTGAGREADLRRCVRRLRNAVRMSQK